MFVDKETTMEERVELLQYANELKSDAKQANMHSELDEFISNAIAKYFIGDNAADSPLDKSEVKENDRYKISQIEEFVEQNKIKNLSTVKAFDLCVNTLNINLEPLQYAESIFMVLWDKQAKELVLGEESSCRYSIAQEVANISIEIYKTKYSSHIILDAIKHIHSEILRKFRAYRTAAESFNNKDFLSLRRSCPAKVAQCNTIALNSTLSQIVDEYGYANVGKLFEVFGYIHKSINTPLPRDVAAVSDVLSKLGYIIYPISTSDLKFSNQCLIYKKELQDFDSKPLSKMNLHLFVFVESATQILRGCIVSKQDREFIYKYITDNSNNIDSQKTSAILEFEKLILTPRYRNGATRNIIDNLKAHDKNAIISALTYLSCLCGDVDRKRLSGLSRVYELFGIKCANLHAMIHRIITGETDIFTTIENEEYAKEFSIPKQGMAKFHIDTDKLTSLENKTNESQKILSEIFASEDDIIEEAPTAQTNPTIELLKTLLEKECWGRAEVEQLCQSRGVMLGATLEQINDYAYEKIDDAVIEDDGDEIYVTTEYKDKLL
ncbi:MAG: tellurite resistance TerB C-terminal domain-containing protein [Rikenellaceae bacterium]